MKPLVYVRSCSIVAAADRLGAGTIATRDRRQFSIVTTSHILAFDLVP